MAEKPDRAGGGRRGYVLLAGQCSPKQHIQREVVWRQLAGRALFQGSAGKGEAVSFRDSSRDDFQRLAL